MEGYKKNIRVDMVDMKIFEIAFVGKVGHIFLLILFTCVKAMHDCFGYKSCELDKHQKLNTYLAKL